MHYKSNGPTCILVINKRGVAFPMGQSLDTLAICYCLQNLYCSPDVHMEVSPSVHNQFSLCAPGEGQLSLCAHPHESGEGQLFLCAHPHVSEEGQLSLCAHPHVSGEGQLSLCVHPHESGLFGGIACCTKFLSAPSPASVNNVTSESNTHDHVHMKSEHLSMCKGHKTEYFYIESR